MERFPSSGEPSEPCVGRREVRRTPAEGAGRPRQHQLGQVQPGAALQRHPLRRARQLPDPGHDGEEQGTAAVNITRQKFISIRCFYQSGGTEKNKVRLP